MNDSALFRTAKAIALRTCLAIALLVPVSAGASGDPFVGRWVLDAKQSLYPPGSCPKTMVIDMEPAGDGIHYRSDTTYADGRMVRAEYTAAYDRKPALVTSGRGMLLPVSLERVDSHTIVASYGRALVVAATSRRTVSADGRQMTIVTTSKDAKGEVVTTVAVFTRASG